jgi:hypothetical protein
MAVEGAGEIAGDAEGAEGAGEIAGDAEGAVEGESVSPRLRKPVTMVPLFFNQPLCLALALTHVCTRPSR